MAQLRLGTTRAAAIGALALAAAACGTEPIILPPPPPPPVGVISIGTSISNATIQQGSSASMTVLILRAGNFTGPVTITVEGLPNGVVATQSNNTTSGTSTTVTITFAVTTSAAPGRTDLTIRAAGVGVNDVTAVFALTVTAAPAPTYQMSLTGSPVTVEQGASGQVTLTIARNGGFAGNVSLTAEGAPAGLTVSINPAATTGDLATISVIAAAGLVPNTYSITIRGSTAALPDRTVTLLVTVTPLTGTGDVVLDFSGCGTPYAIWVAYRDGAGPWTRVISGNALFRFTVNSPTAAFAYVVRQSAAGATTTNVHYMTRAEMSVAPIVYCPPGVLGVKFFNGSVAGLVGSQAAFLSMGNAFGMASGLFPTFSIGPVHDGPRDLLAYRLTTGLPSATDRVIVRRDLNLATGSSLGVLDFSAAEAAPVATGTLTVAGLLAGEGQLETMTYLARATCDAGMLYQVGQTDNPRPLFGVPAAQQRATDFHMLKVVAATATTSRFVEESFQVLASRTLVLGGRLGNPVVTTLPGTYKRLEAVFGLPVEYNVLARLRYLQTSGTPRIVELNATPGWIASTTATLTMPDFSAVTGWSDTWAPGTTFTTPWTITATGGDINKPRCLEGARALSAAATGSN